jgi:phenylacetate-CoA ligase
VAAICEYLGVPHVRCYPFATGICDFDRLTGIFERFGPRCLFTAPGLALQLMRALKRREAFGSSAARIERLMLMGEVVTPSLRAMLAREWRADALDASYGSTETGTIAATCEDGSLHVLAHAFMAEVVLADGTPQPLVPGVRGDLVVTTLNAYARPLLRYETGDSVEVGDGCACGGPLQTITVLGRAAEALTVDGVALDVAAIERVVYGIGGLTGYLVEVRVDDSSLSLVLERDVGTDAAESDIASEALQAFHGLGVDLASVRVVHQLPPSSKSGAAQKNWKKTNVRMVAS